MSIRFAVLGLLAEAPLHGYAAHAAFEARLGEFRELNYGQVYQVLTALERQGLVVATDERVGRRPVRKVYALSPKGREAFEAWLTDAQRPAGALREDLFIRLLFAGDASRARLLALVDAQLDSARAHHAQLAARRPAKRPGAAESFPALVHRLYVEASILQSEATLRALELSRAALAQRGAAEDAAPSPRERAGQGSTPRRDRGGGRSG